MRLSVTSFRRVVLAGASCAPLLLAAAPEAHAAGMPQLDFSNPLVTGQVVWGGVVFLFFYLALRGWALPKVDAVLQNRSERIAGDLDQARAAKAEADKAVLELRETKKAAAAEAQAHLDAVLEHERSSAAAKLAEITERLDDEIARAEAGVVAERERALQSLRPIAVDVAESLVERLIGARADRAVVEAAVARATAQTAH